MSAASNSNESYCTFTLASDVTAGGLPSEEEIAKQLESNDPKVCRYLSFRLICVDYFGELRRCILPVGSCQPFIIMIMIHASCDLICVLLQRLASYADIKYKGLKLRS